MKGLGMVVLGVFAISALLAPVAAAEERMVTVWREVPTDFFDENFDTQSFGKIVEESPSRIVPVQEGDTLSDVIKREFNISSTWTKSVYPEMLASVQNRNKLDDADQIKPGEILVPDLPATTKKNPGPGNPFYPQARLSLGTKGRMVWDSAMGAFSGSPSIDNRNRKAAKTELQIRHVPISQLQYLKVATIAESRTPVESQLQVLDYPVTLALDSYTGAGAHDPFLNTEELASLRRYMAGPVRTKPLLVILDDGWPTQKDFKRAVNFVAKASREIRAAYGLDKAHGEDSQDVKDLLQLKETRFWEDCEYPGLGFHAGMIKESLRELTESDPLEKVEVLYLPVNTAQVGAIQALREVLYVYILARYAGSRLSLQKPSAASEDQHQTARDDARRIVETVPCFHTKYTGAAMSTGSDKAVIESIIDFFALYSAASKRPFILSMAWTVPNLEMPTYFRPNSYGLILAAAGNHAEINIHEQLVQFSSRSLDPGDVIAVQNSASDPTCPTSTFTQRTDLPVYGVAFPGRVNGTLCGTSFSTPRFAWLLAARDAIRGTVPKSREDLNAWSLSQRVRIKDMQSIERTGMERYSIRPLRVLE